MSIKVSILGTGSDVDALTQKEGEGLTVSFEGEEPCFLSWKSFKQLLSLKAAQGKKATQPASAALRVPLAVPANGPVGK